jgi:hypothetical protein
MHGSASQGTPGQVKGHQFCYSTHTSDDQGTKYGTVDGTDSVPSTYYVVP